MTVIGWKDPPPPPRQHRSAEASARWQAVADQLRSRPGEWAFLGVMNSAQGTHIRKGAIAAFRPAGAFEATARNVTKSGQGDVYARYVGGPS